MRTTALCIVCAVLLFASIAAGSTSQVSSDLQSAIDAASAGDTLSVEPGVYDKIAISKSLNLVGHGSVILAGNRDACVSVEADGVSISGFVVRDGFYGIKLNSVKGCRISNNTVIHCTQPGIALLFSDGNTIVGNNASYNGLGGEGWYGIYLSNSNNNLIADNVAYGNGAYGINLFPSCNNNTIRGNVLEGNMYGLYMFTDCANNKIESNIMSRNTNSGLDLRFNCHDNLILNNTLESNVVAGITLMEESGSNNIMGNDVVNNRRYGLQVQSGSDGNLIVGNNISDSQTGIFLDANDNAIYGNRILENVVSAEDRGSNTWNAPYPGGGNLWSDYLGKDEKQGPEQNMAGKDGFGDEPYQINQISLDRYPIMGNQVQQIQLVEKSATPEKIRAGDAIDVKAKLKSKYELSGVTARAYQYGSEAKGYARLTLAGDIYTGKFPTALLDSGTYEIVLSARDVRGYEMKETIGEVEVSPRGSYS